jgi:hypothetical protein
MLLVAACGGAQNPPAPAKSGNTGEIRPVTQAQENVGHFKTADGVYGLILDRSGPKPKVKIDGQSDIIELTMIEDRVTRSGQGPAGSLLGYVLLAPDRTKVLYIGVNGNIRYFHGKDVLDINTDAPADPLGPATVAGPLAPEPPKEKTAWDLEKEKLNAIAVRTKFSDFTEKDAVNLSRVGDAFAKADAGMFVTFINANSSGVWNPTITRSGGSGSLGCEPAKPPQQDDEAKQPLMKYGGWLRAEYTWGDFTTDPVKEAWIALHVPKCQRLAAQTPGLIWSLDSGSAVFVTLDGGRYSVSVGENTSTFKPNFQVGVPPAASWPAPLQDELLDARSVQEMAENGAIPQAVGDAFKARADGWEACAKKVFKKAQSELEANMTVDGMQFYVSKNKNALVLRRYNTKAKTECKDYAAQEAALLAFIAAREKDRQALYAKAKQRISDLGLGK